MILALPVVDGQELTKAVLDSLEQTVTGDNFKVVIFDNASDTSYNEDDYKDYSFPVDVVEIAENIGYYAPLEIIASAYEDELIGLAHNDLVYYERGWNERMEQSFRNDEKLGLVGLCGSNEIDGLGGRGGGTVCYFRGDVVNVGDRQIRGQDQAAGRRTPDLVPSACLDSLFMMFRRDAIESLVHKEDEWQEITLAHFYDRIWPLRLIEAGWHVATLGVECDHLGGMTTSGNERYRDDCIKWLDDHNIPWRIGEDNQDQVIAAEREDYRNQPCGNPETQMYFVAEDRYLTEYREEKKLIPCIVHGDYSHERIAN